MASSFDVMLERSTNATKRNENEKRLQTLYKFITMQEWNKLVELYPDAESWFDINGKPI